MATAFMSATTLARAAAMTLVGDYAADVDLAIHKYRARPKSVEPIPCYFVDRVRESVDYSAAPGLRRRTITVEVLVCWGLFDSGDAVDQRDRFIDGFMDWVTDDVSIIENGTVSVVAVTDEPTFTPDWVPANAQKTYYASRIAVEVFAGG